MIKKITLGFCLVLVGACGFIACSPSKTSSPALIHSFKDSLENLLKAQEILAGSKLRSLGFINMKLDENIHRIESLIRAGSEKWFFR